MARWGVLATGAIANDYAQALKTAGSDLCAVASRDAATAAAFAERLGFRKSYGSYEGVIADAEVNVVYIATPHSHHEELVKACLEAGKHVVCEKPLTPTYRQTAACVALARKKKLLLLEGMWTRFFPAHRAVNDAVAAGRLGDVKSVTASFGFKAPPGANPRLYKKELAGGATLDVGIYPICFAIGVLGEPQNVTAVGRLNDDGTDNYTAITLTYASGAVAQLECAVDVCLANTAVVSGTHGRATVPGPAFHATQAVEMQVLPTASAVDPLLTQTPVVRQTEMLEPPAAPVPYAAAAPGYNLFNSQGFVYQIRAVEAALRAGRTELAEMPLAHTLAAARVMDEVRRQVGVRYPWDEAAKL